MSLTGNYGNKLDENIPPSASTTQPTNAVFDGCKYYFLPWGGTKPCVVVDCSFEDVSWRLEALNVILRIIGDLVSGSGWLAWSFTAGFCDMQLEDHVVFYSLFVCLFGEGDTCFACSVLCDFRQWG